jgi:hypothetical protein
MDPESKPDIEISENPEFGWIVICHPKLTDLFDAALSKRNILSRLKRNAINYSSYNEDSFTIAKEILKKELQEARVEALSHLKP